MLQLPEPHLGFPRVRGIDMSLSMSQAAIPAFDQTLSALLRILQKAEAHCLARKIDASALLTARLYPDMLAFTRQIQIASDAAKGALARLSESEAPKWEDHEQSFADLKARVENTLNYVRSFNPSQIDGSEDRQISLKLPNGEHINFKGDAFLTRWALPNFFFHATTAYAILRHNGVELGKRDFLNAS
jgi:uncharacterized protein